MFLEQSSSGRERLMEGSRRTNQGSNQGHRIRQFLATFKTTECRQKGNAVHDIDNCQCFHDASDRRRKPYNKNSILYSGQLCSDQACSNPMVAGKLRQNCQKAHNSYEVQYHPLNYRTVDCPRFYDCERKHCPHLHDYSHDTITNNFFRFDLNTFKTKSCTIEYQHDLKTCLFYHNLKDRRRPILNYEHTKCQFQNCAEGDKCKYAHNKIEQLYHPSRYKSKFCEKYPDLLAECQYKEFCSFAHSKSQITIELIHEKEKTLDFMINEYKTVWCPYTTPHDRKQCVYAHNIQDFRRAPNQYYYEPEKCPNWNMDKMLKSPEMGGCSKGLLCNKCHGWKEEEYHPQNLKNLKKLKKISNRNFIFDDTYEAKEKILRKIQEKGPKKVANSSKIEPVIAREQMPVMIGAPYFQHSRDLSLSGKVIKPSFKASASDIVTGKDKTKRKQSSQDSFDIKPDRHRIIYKSSLFCNLYGTEDDEYFEHFRHKDQLPYTIDKERAKSTGFYQIEYSRSLNDLFKGTNILNKLKAEKISQIKLVNMEPKIVDTKLNFLSAAQKSTLIQKLKEYNERSEHSSLSYSHELVQFFKDNNREYILQKMYQKRVKEEKLLSLLEKEIQSLSFIEQEDKMLLPKLINEYNNHKEFSDLNSMISIKVSNSTEEVEETAPST